MCRQYGETTDLLRSNMEPPAPVTSWLADFDLDKDEDTVDLLQDLKDNDEDLRHLHLMADIEMSSNDQYVLGRDRENHWLAYFLSKSTQLESLQLGWLTKGDVSLESGNYLIEAMNCLTTIKHFHFDLDSTMGLDSHEEMFDRLQPFFENNPIVTFELDRFGFYSDYYGDMSDQVDVEKEKKFIRGLKKAIKAAANVKCLRFSDDNCFSIHGAAEILLIPESFPTIQDLHLVSFWSDIHKIKVQVPGRQLEYAIPAFLRRGRLANLRTLWLDGGSMGRDELIELLDALPGNNTLKELHIFSIEGECELDDALLEKIGNTMGRNSTLEKLGVRINRDKCTPGGLNS